jgi:serine/threonine protein kinase
VACDPCSPSRCACGVDNMWAAMPAPPPFPRPGKWMVFFTSPQQCDNVWKEARNATLAGTLGFALKCSLGNRARPALMVYTVDHEDERDVMRVRDALRRLLGRAGAGELELRYKRDEETRAGVFSGAAAQLGVRPYASPAAVPVGNRAAPISIYSDGVMTAGQLAAGQPCRFFNTPRGCGKGAQCVYVHDLAVRGGEGGAVRRAHAQQHEHHHYHHVRVERDDSGGVAAAPLQVALGRNAALRLPAQRLGAAMVAPELAARPEPLVTADDVRRLARGVARLPFAQASAACGGFAEANLLGEGGSARVFRGRLRPADSLGAGGAAVVGPAHDGGRDVAVKLFSLAAGAALSAVEARRAALDAFAAEAATLHLFRRCHYVVRLIAYAFEEQAAPPAAGGAGVAVSHPAPALPRLALVLELCEGGTLFTRLFARGAAPPLTPLQRVTIAVGAARGLAALHAEAGAAAAAERLGDGGEPPALPTLHRDIKSANIGLTADLQAKVLDCGLARAHDGVGGAHGRGAGLGNTLQLTASSRLAGTPGYTPPELVDGQYGVRSEVFSLGVVLRELLTGRRAAPGESRDIERRLQQAAAPGRHGTRAAAEAAAMPADAECGWPAQEAAAMRALVLWCTSTHPVDRPENVTQVLAALCAVQRALDPAAPPIRKCEACMDDIPEPAGLLCKAVAGAGRHFLCGECLQAWATAETTGERLREARGCVRCPKAVDGCAAPAWDLGDLRPHLTAPTLAALAADAMAAVGVLAGVEARQRAELQAVRDGRARDRAELQRRMVEAQLLANRVDRVRAMRAAILEEIAYLRCPRCQAAFVDYAGCDALSCGVPGCGAAFCALCLADCGVDAHPHCVQVHGGFFSPAGTFERAHAERRRLLLQQELDRLDEPVDMKAELLRALAHDLRGVGVDVGAIVLARGGAGGVGGAPAEAPRAHMLPRAPAHGAAAAAARGGAGHVGGRDGNQRAEAAAAGARGAHLAGARPQRAARPPPPGDDALLADVRRTLAELQGAPLSREQRELDLEELQFIIARLAGIEV